MKFSRFLISCTLIGIFVAGLAVSASAQLGVGTRALGMGGAYTAIADDESCVYWNPAGLTKVQGISILSPNAQIRIKSNLDWQDVVKNPPTTNEDRLKLLNKMESGVSTVDFSANLGFVMHGFAVSIVPMVNAKLDATGLNIQFDDNGDPIFNASNLTPSSATIGGVGAVALCVSTARQLHNGGTLGVTVKSIQTKDFLQTETYTPNVLTQTVDETSATTKDTNKNGLGVDLGYLQNVSKSTSVGVMVRNMIEPNVPGDFAVRQVSIGVAHRLVGNRVLLAADIANTFDKPELNLGAELNAGKMLCVWGGIYEREMTFGAGVNIFGLQAQLAYSPKNTSMVSAALHF